MTGTKRGAVALVGLLALGAVAAFGWRAYDEANDENGALVLLGNVDVRQVTLAFRIPGRLQAVRAEEGDAIVAGQLLATLQRSDYEDELALARARVEGSEAALEALKSGTRPEEIEQARARVAQARAALQLAATTLARQAELAERNVASHEAHERAQAEYDEANAALEVATEGLALAEAGPRSEEISQARAALAADRAAVSLASRRVEDTALTAPNDGVILARIREPGAIVAAGEPILTLSLTTPVWVRTYVNEPDLGRIEPGMAAEIRTDSGGVYAGQIGFISPVAEFTPKSVETRELRTSLVYRLRVIVDNPDGGLRQGMPVTLTLDTAGGG